MRQLGNWWLAVEDDIEDRTLLRALAGIFAAEVFEINDGYTALEWVRSVHHGHYDGSAPAVAIIEVRISGPRGNEIARYMRRLPAFDQTCIILTSRYAFTEEERAELSAAADADGFVNKPLPSLAELELLFRNAIDHRKASKFTSSTAE